MITDAFKNHLSFFTLDNRRNRSINTPDLEIDSAKFNLLLPPDIVKNKNVLDLGCCVGAAGQWCLYHGARSYTGVEIQHEYVNVARSLLGHHGDKVKICHDDINTFLESAISANEYFDIVIIAGVLYCFLDYYSFLKKCTAVCSDTLAIISDYPAKISNGQNIIQLVELQAINLSFMNGSIGGLGCKLSPDAIRVILGSMGFFAELPILLLPHDSILQDTVYGREQRIRFMARYTKGAACIKTVECKLKEMQHMCLQEKMEYAEKNKKTVISW